MNLIEKTPVLVFWAVQFVALFVLVMLIDDAASDFLIGATIFSYGVSMYFIGVKA